MRKIEQYTEAAQQTVKVLEVFAILVAICYCAAIFEHWQRPDEMKNTVYSVDSLEHI